VNIDGPPSFEEEKEDGDIIKCEDYETNFTELLNNGLEGPMKKNFSQQSPNSM